MNISRGILLCLSLCSVTAQAQQTLTGAAVDATVQAVADVNGKVTGSVQGTASCTDGLGMQITFNAQFDPATARFSGTFTDVPNGTPDTAIVFEYVSGMSWRAHVSGKASSATGPRDYNLSFDFELPEYAIFAGNRIPPERTLQGTLSQTRTVQIPINIPNLFNQVVSVDMAFNGNWNAVIVPKPDGSAAITGGATGTFASVSPIAISFTIPGLGQQSLSIPVSGSFGGNLFVVSATEVAFRGAWTATGGSQNFGGDLNISVPLANGTPTSFPFDVSGVLDIRTGVSQFPSLQVPFSVSGEFPFNPTL